ncbi:class I SAM-dependent methyltransferase [Bradyrhizobium sp. AUGA SZCCT0240]|uniref:class I SAM-dependent methyltransferase n=1 Tax=unclassified Bradyrhizobium TaxID=2631580 RepID=UPI001BAC18C1|nr:MULTISPECIES: class I SAM-dependent methyltransferase [unclassified Bradyrhizobium]MBR1195918.1 class I SAM-dependent methyltransferase [Bradyrhizobium sp. AUGA SZCCT0158]MBR1240755.1 class I SAM-dependent methyltransferase [Bradyrhizobium sp. AUGA SZCCT0274]MBR1252221.1 class I SAM-dependent methyltransferase [Bradyrhizobium sp. AUGA SZCCT0240]
MRNDAAVQAMLDHFFDPDTVKHYAEGPRRFVPGFADLHRMTSILLAEHAPQDARVLVLGAGGGLELNSMAETAAGWTFVGVDPAAEMLKLAERILGPLSARVQLQQGYIDDAPDGPFDAATCLLTLHFLDADERRRTAGEIHRRLKPGAPFVAAHSSFPQGARAQWLSRYAAFGIASGADPDKANGARAAVDKNLNLFSPEQDAQILREAGFKGVELFYAAFTWRGWIAYA